MINLNNKEWKTFSIGEQFIVSGTTTTVPKELLSNGNVPRITCAATNNGLDDFYKNDATEKGGIITIDSAAIGFTAFQASDFIATDHVEKIDLNIEKVNHYVGLFIKQAIDTAILKKYNYGYKFSQTRIKRQKILLPVDDLDKPDFVFMKSYMREQEATKKLSYIKFAQKQIAKINYKELPLISELNWQDFKVCDLFDYKRGNQKNMSSLAEGNTMLISAKNIDNGLKGFFNSNTCKNDIYKGNCISLNNDGDGGVGLAYYQPHDFLLDTHVYALYPKSDLSSYSMIYITIALSKQRSCFHHGYSISQERLKKMKIMLPVNTQGKPYYEYMEQYTKNIMYVKLKKYLEYVDHEIPREE